MARGHSLPRNMSAVQSTNSPTGNSRFEVEYADYQLRLEGDWVGSKREDTQYMRFQSGGSSKIKSALLVIWVEPHQLPQHRLVETAKKCVNDWWKNRERHYVIGYTTQRADEWVKLKPSEDAAESTFAEYSERDRDGVLSWSMRCLFVVTQKKLLTVYFSIHAGDRNCAKAVFDEVYGNLHISVP